MVLLICNSNMFVPGVVTRVLKSSREQFVIYTDMPGMESFFKEMDFHNATVLRYPNSYSIRTLGKVKKQMLQQLQVFEINQLEFYHTEAGQLANWLITKYSPKCDIYNCSPYKPMPLQKVKGLRRIKLKLLDWFLFHYEADPRLQGNVVATSIAPSFYRWNNIKKGKFIVDEQANFAYLMKKYPALDSNKSIIILTGSIIDSGGDPQVYDSLIAHIIEVVGTDKIITKCHPLFNDEYGVEKTLAKLPAYLPFNMIIPMFEVVISPFSTSLAEAADAGKKAISTIFLIPFKDMGYRTACYDTLVSRNTGLKKVCFPKSLEELDVLLTTN